MSTVAVKGFLRSAHLHSWDSRYVKFPLFMRNLRQVQSFHGPCTRFQKVRFPDVLLSLPVETKYVEGLYRQLNHGTAKRFGRECRLVFGWFTADSSGPFFPASSVLAFLHKQGRDILYQREIWYFLTFPTCLHMPICPARSGACYVTKMPPVGSEFRLSPVQAVNTPTLVSSPLLLLYVHPWPSTASDILIWQW